MADVFKRVRGRKLTKIIAMHRVVQDRLDKEAFAGGMRAERKLLEHRDSGASTIAVDEGDVDRYVVLDDTRGLRAALSIEFGRGAIESESNGKKTINPPTKGLFVLHDAFGLPHGE